MAGGLYGTDGDHLAYRAHLHRAVRGDLRATQSRQGRRRQGEAGDRRHRHYVDHLQRAAVLRVPAADGARQRGRCGWRRRIVASGTTGHRSETQQRLPIPLQHGAVRHRHVRGAAVHYHRPQHPSDERRDASPSQLVGVELDPETRAARQRPTTCYRSRLCRLLHGVAARLRARRGRRGRRGRLPALAPAVRRHRQRPRHLQLGHQLRPDAVLRRQVSSHAAPGDNRVLLRRLLLLVPLLS